MEALNLLVTTANVFFQFNISGNVRQSLSDNDNIPEEVVELSCVIHKNCIDGRWKNARVCSQAGTNEMD
jgi:hypothetical protein